MSAPDDEINPELIPDVCHVAVTRPEPLPLAVLVIVLAEKRTVTVDGEPRVVVSWRREATPELVEREVREALPDALSWRRIERGEVPERRDFRLAWRDTGSAIEHDMPKARQLKREQIRARRKVLLTDLDVRAVRALEDGDAVASARVRSEKQRLRDLPADPRIDAARAVEDLDAIRVDP